MGPTHRFVAAFQDIGDQLAVEVAELMLGFFLQAVDAHVELADFTFESLAPFRQILLLLFSHRLHVFVRHGMAGRERDNAETRGCFFETKSSCAAQFRQFVKERFFLQFDVLIQLGLGIEILLALKRQGNIPRNPSMKPAISRLNEAPCPAGNERQVGREGSWKLLT